ncbi:hypothetical protein BD410DRAFT_843952 [Rickenella mellea]|uniref:AGC-kinase C-terminal domain-containing protein n=1 Tax=Rickenella mellea TaxID=50990 RepID=A0A4Y7PPQ8_9AGAM|nr:hypothetical protein BD410DRAFT_843952 [Rickenella mellea]
MVAPKQKQKKTPNPPYAVHTRLQLGFCIASLTKDGVGRLDQHGNAVLPPRLHYAISPRSSPPPLSAPGDVCVDVLKKVLDRNPHCRLAEGKGMDKLRADSWFSSINWENLEVKEEHLPFVLDIHDFRFHEAAAHVALPAQPAHHHHHACQAIPANIQPPAPFGYLDPSADHHHNPDPNAELQPSSKSHQHHQRRLR